jgi:hypothetical protein
MSATILRPVERMEGQHCRLGLLLRSVSRGIDNCHETSGVVQLLDPSNYSIEADQDE